MKIGLDLDDTVYAYPEFFRELIESFHARGHTFFCTSGHARSEWERDCEQLRMLGIDPDKISPELMYPERNPHVHLKGRQADQMDFVFDDDARVQKHTATPVFCSPDILERRYHFAKE